jgi:hypothetical protein
MRRTISTWLTEVGAWLIDAGIRVGGRAIKGLSAPYECGFPSAVNETPQQYSARHLESVWIEREQRLRSKSKLPGGLSSEAEAVKECRLDLQYEFRLVRRLGPGPMTEAEAEEYGREEIAASEKLNRD